MSRTGIKLKRYSKEERNRHFDNWQSSGVSAASFCEAHDINLGTFDYWCRLYRKYGKLTRPSKTKPSKQASFKEIEPRVVPCSSPIELHYPNGVVLKLGESSIEQLKQLIHA